MSSRLCGTGLRSNPAKTSWHVVWTDAQVLLGAAGALAVADGNTEKGAEFGQTVTSPHNVIEPVVHRGKVVGVANRILGVDPLNFESQ